MNTIIFIFVIIQSQSNWSYDEIVMCSEEFIEDVPIGWFLTEAEAKEYCAAHGYTYTYKELPCLG